MRKLAAGFIVVIFLIVGISTAFAEEGYSYVLIEANTGTVIGKDGAEEQRNAASLTKLMSYLLFCEGIDSGAFKLTDTVSVSGEAAKKGGTRVFLDAGTQYSLEKLLEAAIVCSANDATAALAEHYAGSESAFVAQMNDRAKELGLSCTFKNATGLANQDQLISAADLAKIACELSKHQLFFKYSTVFSGTFVHQSGRTTEMVNANKLVKQMTGCTGMATGSSDQAGYCAAVSADSGQARYIAVVLGAKNSGERFSAAQKLIEEAAAQYTVKHIAKKGQLIKKNYPVSSGGKAVTNITAANDCTVLLKKGEDVGLEKAFELPDTLQAPINAGDKVGMMRVYSGENEIAAVELEVGEDIEIKTFWSCLKKIASCWLY